MNHEAFSDGDGCPRSSPRRAPGPLDGRGPADRQLRDIVSRRPDAVTEPDTHAGRHEAEPDADANPDTHADSQADAGPDSSANADAGSHAHAGAVSGGIVITINGLFGSNSFQPANAVARVGQTVTWKNADTMIHNIGQGGGAFSVPDIAPGAKSHPVKLTTAGTFPYFCVLHPAMTGSLRVDP